MDISQEKEKNYDSADKKSVREKTRSDAAELSSEELDMVSGGTDVPEFRLIDDSFDEWIKMGAKVRSLPQSLQRFVSRSTVLRGGKSDHEDLPYYVMEEPYRSMHTSIESHGISHVIQRTRRVSA